MTVTYDPNLADNVSLVRFEIGETDTAISIISDEEITYWVNQYAGQAKQIIMAALQCARALAARTAHETTRTLGPLTVEARRHDHYNQLVSTLESRLRSDDVLGTPPGFALLGVNTEAGNENLFEIAMHDLPGSPTTPDEAS